MRVARRAVLPVCLCAALFGWWGAAPRGAAGQVRQAGSRLEELEEASRLNEQVMKLYGEGRYAEAVTPAERALNILEKALGPDHQDVAIGLDNLAQLYSKKGDLARAEPLYVRALAVREKALGPEHPLVATSLNNLAELYRTKGDYALAEPLYYRALAIDEKAFGPEHPELAPALNNLAELYRAKGDYALAEPLFRRSLAINAKALGPEHPSVVPSLDNLAGLYREKGDLARAEPLFRYSLAVREKALGPEHPLTANSLNNLATVYVAKGDYARAEPLLGRVLAVYEKGLGPEHPSVATSLNNLAALYETKGDYARAVQFQVRGNEVRERNLSLILATSSERQKLTYLATLSGETHATISLHARSAPSDPQALRLALTTVLRRKGRALDAMSDQISSLRRRLGPRDRALLDQLSATQSRLAALVLGGPGNTPPREHRAAVVRLAAEVEDLQDAVSRRSAELPVRTQPVTVEQVRRALPAGAALAEFFSYRPFEAKAKTQAERFGPARYVAYVLGGAGEPLWADLGGAKEIEADASRLLKALKCPQSADDVKECPAIAEVKQLARAVDERVMRPVRKLLGGTRQVFLSPDGALNLVPFAALVDESGKYLVESLSLTYLTSGRDLPRLQLSSEGRQPPLVLADPAFGEGRAVLGSETSRRSAELGRVYFPPLPGTAAEAKALGTVLPDVRVLTQERATEAALKQAGGPRVLHIATHGFFLPDQPQEAADGTRGLKLVVGELSPAMRVENPLLHSGLALAGANRRQDANGEDGILTALEAAALDLWGTKLVVLSACETGVGEVKTGEGVYGLRRALVLAGSESQVMSLWQVSDTATTDLMVSYYERLATGEARTEALRQVQLEMLTGGGQVSGGRSRDLSGKGFGATADRRHPYYWAAFIQSGDWRGMGARPAVTR
jgi:CHAT domain-containing protein/tetratricopeptide (TPR) repeat protein